MDTFDGLFSLLMEGGVEPIVSEEMKADRLPRAEALKRADMIKAELVELGIDPDLIELGGSIRRGKDTAGDLDIAIFDYEKVNKSFYQKFVMALQNKGHEVKVRTLGDFQTSVAVDNFLIELKKAPRESYGGMMLHITGSGDYNKQIRGWVKGRGYKLNQYGLFDAKTGKMYPSDTEEKIFQELGVPYVDPEDRATFRPPREERVPSSTGEPRIPEEIWAKVPEEVKAELKGFDLPSADENGIKIPLDFLYNKKARQRYHINYSQMSKTGADMKPKFELPEELKLDRYAQGAPA